MSVPTYAQPDQQQSRRTRRTLWIILGSTLALALIGSAAFVWLAFSSALTSIKQTGSIPERYYLNILGGDYTTAYSYLDSHATIAGQLVTDQQTFTRLARAA